MKRIAIVMAGGVGERFWPVSRRHRPKQLLRLTRPDMSLLDEAAERITPLMGIENVYIATGKNIKPPIMEAEIVAPENVWAEPLKRNTLGALCWVAAKLLAKEGTEVSLAILTADHLIGSSETFQDQVRLALDIAEERGAIVTMGIPPTRPETGFGYIETDPATEGPDGVFRVKTFREKPDLPTAENFLKQGSFLWNSGMFFVTLPTLLRELGATQPRAKDLTLNIAEALKRNESEEAERLFAQIPNISFDFAVMEQSKSVAVVQAAFDWDDVGSWDALSRTLETDEKENVIYGDALVKDSEGCVIYNDSETRLTTVLGVTDLLVVVTDDAVMVCPKADAQRVREIVERVKEHRPELT